MTKKAIGAVLFLAAAGLLYWHLFSKPQVVPIYGRWISDDPPYDTCHMEITPQRIVFGEGEKRIGDHRVLRVADETQDGKSRYTVYYDDDGELKLTFEFKADNGGEIRIQNQEQILWTRAAKAGPP